MKFYKKSEYEIHQKYHAGRIVCDNCGKSLRTLESLKKHMKPGVCKATNTSFECEICHQVFSSIKKLTTHQRVHSEGEGYECEVCHRKFSTVNILADHLEKCHIRGELETQDTKNVFVEGDGEKIEEFIIQSDDGSLVHHILSSEASPPISWTQAPTMVTSGAHMLHSGQLLDGETVQLEDQMVQLDDQMVQLDDQMVQMAGSSVVIQSNSETQAASEMMSSQPGEMEIIHVMEQPEALVKAETGEELPNSSLSLIQGMDGIVYSTGIGIHDSDGQLVEAQLTDGVQLVENGQLIEGQFVENGQFVESGQLVEGQFVGSGQLVEGQLIDSGQLVEGELIQSAQLIDGQLVEGGQLIDSQLVEGGQLIDGELVKGGQIINGQLVEGELAESGEMVDEVLSGDSDSVVIGTELLEGYGYQSNVQYQCGHCQMLFSSIQLVNQHVANTHM